jgi:hypothetical protein
MSLSKTLKMPLLASERDHKVFCKNQSIRGFFGFESSFQNCLWNLFSTFGLSQISEIRNVWKFPSPFSRNILIPRSEKTSWSSKTSFWNKNCPKNSKMAMKIFQAKGFPWFWGFLLGYARTMKFRD